MGGLEALIMPAMGTLAGSTMGTMLGETALLGGLTGALNEGLGMYLTTQGVGSALGGTVGGLGGSTLNQVAGIGGKGAVPDLPNMAGAPAGLGQTMGKQGAFAVPVPPPIQSASIKPIGAAMQTIGARQDPLEELRRLIGV